MTELQPCTGGLLRTGIPALPAHGSRDPASAGGKPYLKALLTWESLQKVTQVPAIRTSGDF